MTDSRLFVACLCAAWCTSCRGYRAVFDDAAAAHPDATFRWVDVEDEAALVDDVDVASFPTVLIAGAGPHFFGAILPQPGVLARLIAAHRGAASGAFAEEIVQLARRLHE